jgi:hypothetical protein
MRMGGAFRYSGNGFDILEWEIPGCKMEFRDTRRALIVPP